jgi:hypothetical protein
VAEHVFEGQCSRCKCLVAARLEFTAGSTGGIAPPPVIGSYCNCGGKDSPGGLVGQAVPLTLRGTPE